MVRILASELKKEVMVVDTSNEIGGGGLTPHPCIQPARRMPVGKERQDKLLIQAVQNHTPEVVVIDEIGTKKEVIAAKTIAQRGVAMVATAHGTSLETLVKDPDLVHLIGGTKSATLGDSEARLRSQGTNKPSQKTITERAGSPTFSVVVEIQSYKCWRIHHDVAASVDSLLRGNAPKVEQRQVNADGSVTVKRATSS